VRQQRPRPALRYHGGKWKLAPWIIGHFPQHRVYVEPFGGGCSVLLRKPRSHAEVYNDLADDIVAFFRVLRNPEQAARLIELLRLTPFARLELEGAYEQTDDPVERARRVLVRSFMGFGSASAICDHATGFRANSSKSGTTPARDWAHFPDALAMTVERQAGVVIEHRDAVACMQQHDSQQTLFYVDPPYVHSTRVIKRTRAGQVYEHEMDDAAHRRLAAWLHSCKSMVILSGYRCDLYDELYHDWQRVDTLALADGARKRTESLWINPAAMVARQVRYKRPEQRLLA